MHLHPAHEHWSLFYGPYNVYKVIWDLKNWLTLTNNDYLIDWLDLNKLKNSMRVIRLKDVHALSIRCHFGLAGYQLQESVYAPISKKMK